MNRLPQDAAETLAAYEHMQAVRNRALADWEAAQQPAPTETWAPTMNEQQKQKQAEYIKRHSCQF